MNRLLLLAGLIFVKSTQLSAQAVDSTKALPAVNIVGYKAMNGIGHINEYADQIIFAGKKNELLTIDSLDANKAVNNTRQIIGRIPGLNIIETEAGGFTANGIGFRGLNGYQSIEMNTRQNGYGVSADIFGYNEAYYLPPMEAVHSIQFLRGAAGLQFGPQIGGLVNYIIKDAPEKPFEVTVSQTAGSYGLYNAFTSLGGTQGKLKYYGYVQYRQIEGYRANADERQISGFGKLSYDFTSKLQVSLEYSLLRNKIHMPGGLTDLQFEEDPRQSGRERNWLESPWNILSSNILYKISKNSSISLKTAYLFSERNLIWRNEDGWPDERDTITPSGSYVERELEREYFKSVTNELRFLTNYKLGNHTGTLALGARQAYSFLRRLEGAKGSTGTGFDLTLYSPYEVALDFKTNNLALFGENIFRIGPKLSITPGVRLEYLATSLNGAVANEDDTTGTEPFLYSNNDKFSRTFVLAGIGLQYALSNKINLYGNYSQSYRPITYSDLTPFGSIAKIDKNLKDATADNADIGIRGTVKNIINFDVTAFYLKYKNRIGIVEKTDNAGNLYPLRTNTGASEHTGVEAYAELNIINLCSSAAKPLKISVYNSFAYVHAIYTEGKFKGNTVEYAPRIINRAGINIWYKNLSLNGQFSYVGEAWGDAANTVFSKDALVGKIPAYSVIDLSASYKWKAYQVKLGVNNVADAKYFTLRTAEYPGPGIIPSVGRMIYGGLSLTL